MIRYFQFATVIVIKQPSPFYSDVAEIVHYFPISKRVVTVFHRKRIAALEVLCLNSVFPGWKTRIWNVNLSDAIHMDSVQYLSVQVLWLLRLEQVSLINNCPFFFPGWYILNCCHLGPCILLCDPGSWWRLCKLWVSWLKTD